MCLCVVCVLLIVVLALLANNPTPSTLTSELQELTILSADELAKLVEEIFQVTHATHQTMIAATKPTPAAASTFSNKTATTAPSSPSAASSSSVVGRKRLDRSATQNPEVSTLAQPSKMIKLSSSHASVAGQPPSKAAANAAEPLEPVVDAAGQPTAKKIVKLGSSSAANRKARFASTTGTSSSSSSMDIDASTSQPSVPVKVAPAATAITAASGNSIRKLRDPNAKKWTYEDEEKMKKEKAEQFRKQREEADRAAAQAAEAAAAKKRVRCSFWPQCVNGDMCEYHHPTAICTKFPHCNFGDSCLFIHPAIPCRFGLGCTNANCSFAHPPGRRIPNHKPTPGAPNSNPTLCKFGANCARVDCVFTHPPGRALPLGGKVTPATQIVCRFDPKCATFPKCPFVHPSKGQKVQTEAESESKPSSESAPDVLNAPLD